VANYNVDIAIALKNSNKLTKLRKELKGATDNIREFNKEASKQNKVAVSTFGKLNKQISRARSLLDKAAIGTSSFTRAARAAVAVEKEMNLQLRQKEKLLAKIRAESVTSGQQTVIDRTARARQVRSGFAAFSSNANQITQSAKIEAVKNKARDRHLKNIDKKVAKIATIQTQQQSQRAFAGLPGGFGVPGGQIGPALPMGFRVRQQFKQGGMFGMPGGAMGRLRGGAGSAMIGGGFPLLFGAGGLSSIMGGIAGGIGGALAPGGGFAASIAATAVAAQIEKVRAFRKEVRTLNKDMSSMGIESEFSRKQIKDLAKEFDITNQEAVKLAAQFKTFGPDQAGTLLSAFGSREVFDSLSGLRDTESVLGKIQQLRDNISETTRQDLLQTLATEGPLKAQVKLQEEIYKIRRKAAVDKKIEEFDFGFKNTRGKYKQAYDTIEEREARITKQRLIFNNEYDETNKKANQFLETQIKINEQMQFLAEFNAPYDQIRELMNPMRSVIDLSREIKTGFEDSFKGIIKGTMSVSDAFRSMLNRIADYFLDTAAQLVALSIQKGFLGLFSSMFSFSGTDTFAGLDRGPANPNTITMDSFRANGGSVKGGRSYIVGERGPEMFTPGVSGMVTPNEMLGGSTNIVVNVDASGSSVEGDEQQGRQLGELISAAIQSELINQKRPGGLLS
tara:strand:- start:4653 stop:6683 length:2031 start_codon:yes stop_codon:yes gene_type:complete